MFTNFVFFSSFCICLFSFKFLLIFFKASFNVVFKLSTLSSRELVKFEFKYVSFIVLLDTLLHNLDNTILLLLREHWN